MRSAGIQAGGEDAGRRRVGTWILGGALSAIRLTDRDAILVRNLPTDQFQVLSAGSDTFAAFISAPIAGGAGGSVESLQTYAFVDIGVPGAQFRVTTTHLEPNVASIQDAQGDEWIASLGGASLPQIVLGDFNSRADGLGTDTYSNMLAAGFKDAWLEQGSGNGFTCCQAAHVLNDPSALDQRIDFVFHRARFETVRIDVIGEAPGDRAASGHCSDHAGCSPL